MQPTNQPSNQQVDQSINQSNNHAYAINNWTINDVKIKDYALEILRD